VRGQRVRGGEGGDPRRPVPRQLRPLQQMRPEAGRPHLVHPVPFPASIN
jgi:hypothetical protein